MSKKFIPVYFIFLTFFIMMLPDRSLAQSPPQTEEFGGLDIIFLIDQSGSMSGCPDYPDQEKCAKYDHPRPNDPQELRQYSPRFVIDFLGTDALYYHPKAIHRIAAINFGTDAYVDLEWTEIAPDDQEGWGPTAKRVKNELKSDKLVYTDPKEAIEMAQKLFTQLPSLSNGYRKKVLILKTDGQPFLPTIEEWYRGGKEEEYKKEMAALLNNGFLSSEYRVCVVAMNDFESDYWPAWEAYWLGPTQGCVRKLERNADVPKVFWDLLTSLLPPSTDVNFKEITLGQTAIPPYLYLLIFTFYKTSEEVKVGIYDANSTPVVVREEDIARNGPIERVQIKRPEPGFWRTEITETPGGEETVVGVTMETLLVTAKLRGPVGQVYQYDQKMISYILEDRHEGQIVRSHPDYSMFA